MTWPRPRLSGQALAGLPGGLSSKTSVFSLQTHTGWQTDRDPHLLSLPVLSLSGRSNCQEALPESDRTALTNRHMSKTAQFLVRLDPPSRLSPALSHQIRTFRRALTCLTSTLSRVPFSTSLTSDALGEEFWKTACLLIW